MGGGHAHDSLLVHHDTVLRRMRPECKVLATVLFVFAVVSAPREAFWVYAVYSMVVIALARLAELPMRRLARRLTIELPFIAFALMLPLLSRGPRVDVVGISLSTNGLWAAWNILIKATLGVAATAILAATTPVPAMLRGLERLRMPRIITSVAGFMVRYGEVLTSETRRMKIARLSRGYDPRWLWQARALATSTGTLFVRSYERGERVYLAMVARGFDGSMPLTDEEAVAPPCHWAAALSVPAAAAALSCTAWALR